MKNFKQLFAYAMLLVLPMVIIISCDDEETPFPPTVTTSTSVTNVNSGATADISFSVTTAGGYKSAAIAQQTGGTASIKSEPAAGAIEGTVVVSFTAGNAAGAGLVNLSVTDNRNISAQATAALSVILPNAPTLTAPTSAASVKFSTAADVTFAVTIPGGYKSSSVSGLVGGTAVVKSAPAVGATSGNIVVTYTAGAQQGAGSVQLNVTDNFDRVAFSVATLSITLDAPPTVTLNKVTAISLAGGTVSVQVTISALNGGKELIVTGATTTPASPILFTETAKVIDLLVNVPGNATAGSKINSVFTVKDAKDLLSSSVSLEIEVTAANTEILVGTLLTSRTLDASIRYIIRGQVFVPDGITIVIPAGTILLGEKASKGTLIVERGGKLECNGTLNAPVVMTSNQEIGARDKGDWGGLVILGKAYTNQSNPAIEGISPPKNFGAADRTNDADNSGIYKYLRVEYAGIELTPNNETNSITMGSVGSGTVMEHMQVSFGGDDGFEWFGGTVNGKYLISLSTWDDDFDGDFGWSGKVQFGLVVRNPFAADQSQSNAFEIDNGPNDNDTGAGTYTTATFSNITVYGPRDHASRSNSANNVHAIDLRRRVAASIFNSVVGGFPSGVRFNQNSVYAQYVPAGTANGVLSNNLLIAASGTTRFPIGSGVSFTSAELQTYWLEANAVEAIPASDVAEATYNTMGLRLNNFFARYSSTSYPVDPDFTLSSGSPTLGSGAAFTNAKVSDAFFTVTTYRGAFDGTTDWTDGWANFRPIETPYQ